MADGGVLVCGHRREGGGGSGFGMRDGGRQVPEGMDRFRDKGGQKCRGPIAGGLGNGTMGGGDRSTMGLELTLTISRGKSRRRMALMLPCVVGGGEVGTGT